MIDHDDECDKTMYGPEGICTCPDLADADSPFRVQHRYDEPSANAMTWAPEGPADRRSAHITE